VDFSSSQFLKGYHDMCIRFYGSKGTMDSHYGGFVKMTGDIHDRSLSRETEVSRSGLAPDPHRHLTIQQQRFLASQPWFLHSQNQTSICGLRLDAVAED